MQNPIDINGLREIPDGSSREATYLRALSGAYDDIYVSVLSIVANRADADDVIQEVCVVLWQKFDEFEPGTNFRKWACAFAFNVAKAFVRHQRRRRGFGLSDQALMKISKLQTAGSELFELRREVLQSCMSRLRAKEQRFLMTCYGRRISLVDYARTEGIPVTTVYTRLRRLRKQLVECVNRALGREGEGAGE